jgi:hypothetical protein
VRNDRYGRRLQPLNPAAAAFRSQRRRAIGETGHQDRRGQRERHPGGKQSRIARALQPDRHADLAGGRAGQELAERHEIGIGLIADPVPALHECLAEISEMGDRSTERGQAKAEEDAEDLRDRPSAICHPCIRRLLVHSGPRFRQCVADLGRSRRPIAALHRIGSNG